MLTTTTFADRLMHLFWLILVGFGAVALGLVYWSVIRAPALLAREDNPRLIEAELRLERGRILDRNGYQLAASSWTGERRARTYDRNALSPSVGYYSLRFGTAGIEDAFDAILRGGLQTDADRLADQLLHQPPIGNDVRLTLDAATQASANALMQDQSGALVLLEIMPGSPTPTAEIRAMVSVPGYDPADLDASFEALLADVNAPLFNRAAQGLYQPGMLLQPFLMAGALSQGAIALEDPVATPDQPVAVNGHVLGCHTALEATEPGQLPAATWDDVLVWGCPGPMSGLGEQLGAAELATIFSQFGLDTAPPLSIPTTATTGAIVTQPDLAAVGQDTLTVTPLQAALAMAALGTGGTLPQSRLVDAIQRPDGQWEPWVLLEQTATPGLDRSTTSAVLRTLTGEDGIAGLLAVALSGPEGGTNVWYAGTIPATAPQFVVAVVLEDSSDTARAEEIGKEMLRWAVAIEPATASSTP